MGKVTFSCCFCGTAVEPDEGFRLVVFAPEPYGDDIWQQWWCHPLCFNGVLVAQFRNQHRDEIQEAIMEDDRNYA